MNYIHAEITAKSTRKSLDAEEQKFFLNISAPEEMLKDFARALDDSPNFTDVVVTATRNQKVTVDFK